MPHLHTHMMTNVEKILCAVNKFLKKLHANLDSLRISISPSYDDHVALRKFLGWLMVVGLIASFYVFLILINYIWIVNECMYQKYMALCWFKVLLVLISVNIVLYIIQNYLSFFIENWGFIRSWPTSHKIILFSYISFTFLLFSYIFNAPLLFNFITISEVLNPLDGGVILGGCSEYCTVGPGCSDCFYTADFSYHWDFGFELQRDMFVLLYPTVNIAIRVDNLIGVGVVILPISFYWRARKK